MGKVDVSVVIPAYNEEKYIKNSLSSLSRSAQKTDINYEVVLVDNNSTDKTVDIAKTFKNDMNLRIISETRQGRGAARARGFEEAKGDILISADSDAIFYEGWIETLVTELKGDVVVVTTSCKIVDCASLTNVIFNFGQPISMVLYRIMFGHYWFSGFGSSILKSAYKRSGGFNPTLQAQEDLDLSFRVAKFGKIKFINKPVIFSGRRFKNGLLAGCFEYIYTFFEAFLFKKSVYLDNPR